MIAGVLRLLTYNLESLGKRHGAPPLDARIAVLRPRLVGLAADLLCLQEVDGERSTKEQPREPRALRRTIQRTPYTDFHMAVTPGPSGKGVADRHNLATLSRLPIAAMQAIRHELVAPPKLRTDGRVEMQATFDRPLLHVSVVLAGGDTLHLINLHLRAPLAAPIAGARTDAGGWRTASDWAVGYQLAAMKRTAQALEARLLVDRLLDRDADALIAVCGDLNAVEIEVPTRLLKATVDDTQNPLLTGRALVSLADLVPADRRFSVWHHGHPVLVDHILASPALAARCRTVEIHNQGLVDEAAAERLGAAFIDSTHAPVVAVFDLE